MLKSANEIREKIQKQREEKARKLEESYLEELEMVEKEIDLAIEKDIDKVLLYDPLSIEVCNELVAKGYVVAPLIYGYGYKGAVIRWDEPIGRYAETIRM